MVPKKIQKKLRSRLHVETPLQMLTILNKNPHVPEPIKRDVYDALNDAYANKKSPLSPMEGKIIVQGLLGPLAGVTGRKATLMALKKPLPINDPKAIEDVLNSLPALVNVLVQAELNNKREPVVAVKPEPVSAPAPKPTKQKSNTLQSYFDRDIGDQEALIELLKGLGNHAIAFKDITVDNLSDVLNVSKSIARDIKSNLSHFYHYLKSEAPDQSTVNVVAKAFLDSAKLGFDRQSGQDLAEFIVNNVSHDISSLSSAISKVLQISKPVALNLLNRLDEYSGILQSQLRDPGAQEAAQAFLDSLKGVSRAAADDYSSMLVNNIAESFKDAVKLYNDVGADKVANFIIDNTSRLVDFYSRPDVGTDIIRPLGTNVNIPGTTRVDLDFPHPQGPPEPPIYNEPVFPMPEPIYYDQYVGPITQQQWANRNQ